MLKIDRYLGLSLLVVVSIGCQDSLGGPQAEKPMRPAPASQPATQPTSAATQAASTEPAVPRTVVKLLNAGQEPRRPLRFSVKKGQKQRAEVTMQYTNSLLNTAKSAALQKEPVVKVTIETEVIAVSESGEISYRFGFVDADAIDERGLEQNVVESRRMIVQQLIGAAGTVVVSDRGETKSAQIATLPNAAAQYRAFVASRLQQLRTALAQTWPRLPDEPVGVGARWEVSTTSTANPYLVRLSQTVVYEVVAIEGDRITLKLTINESGGRQLVQRQLQTDPTVRISVVDNHGTGSGAMTLDLSSLLPQLASLNMTSTYDVEYDTSGQIEYMQSELKTQNLLETLH